ncbi:MAG: TetR/AcrR family transcriptional regulator, partial [Chloroflexi bacterium]|nr:TetR/AcrR family transcriptional regulator [Chloroflexota bacterium]
MSEQDLSLNVIANSNPVRRQERRDAAANRALILETAEKLFAEKGVENVNMADIAQAAGVGKGTLYRRFANKGELCLALMDTQMVEFQNSMLSRMQQLSAQGVDYLEQLDQFLDALVYFTDIHSPLLCVVQHAGLLQGVGSSTRAQLPYFWQHMTISGLLKTAVSAGELSPDLDIDYLSDALLSSLKADIFHFQRQVRGFSLERISIGLRTLVAGLKGI